MFQKGTLFLNLETPNKYYGSIIGATTRFTERPREMNFPARKRASERAIIIAEI